MDYSTKIDIPGVVFGTPRTGYSANGSVNPAVYVQDVWHGEWILRYTSPNGCMSVYRKDADAIRCIAEKSILTNELGEPTKIIAVQRYFPSTVFLPLELEISKGWSYSTVGEWGWLAEDNDPTQPIAGAKFQHDIELYTDGINLWMNEKYWDNDKLVYSRNYHYDVASKFLIAFYDNLYNLHYTAL